MITTTFHHSCMYFLVLMYAAAAPILVSIVNIVVDLPLYSGYETITTRALFYGSE